MPAIAALISILAASPVQASSASAQVGRVSESVSQTVSDTVFIDIDELVRTAIVHNLRLRSATAEMVGNSSYAAAARSRYDPVLNVGGDTETNGVGGQLTGLLPTGATYLMGSVAPTSMPGEPLFPNALVAGVNQPVLRGLGFLSSRYAIRAVDEGIAASRATLARTRAEVAATIRIAYATLVERHRQESIAAESVRRAEDLRDAYTELRALEKITRVDLITAQLGAASRTATLLQVRSERREAEDVLIFAVYGARASTMFARGEAVLMPRDTTVAVPALPDVAIATESALAARPDVIAARHEAARARFQSGYARNASLPTLNIYGAFTSTLSGSSTAFARGNGEPRIQDWSGGIVFSRPLRNSGANAERERAEAAQTQADVAVADAENVVRAEVRAAYRDIELGREQVALAEQASQLAREQYEGGRDRLNLGLTDIFRVLQYEEQVSRVESAEALARLGLAVAVARYRLAVGAEL